MRGIQFWDEIVVLDHGDNAEDEVHSDDGGESEEDEPAPPMSSIETFMYALRMILNFWMFCCGINYR
jgi:hypothetical protein